MKNILMFLALVILFCNSAFSASENTTFELAGLDDAIVSQKDSIPYDSIKNILENAYHTDQEIREKLSTAEGNDSLFMSYLGEMSVVDRKNRAAVIPLLEKYGWFRISEVGAKASDGLFYVLQHTVDLDLFRKYLPEIKRLSAHNEAKLWHAALIEDRLLMNENKKQIYGSQVVTRKSKYDGAYFVWPVKDPQNVNSLRKNAGLSLTVEENAKRLNAIYNPNEEIPNKE